jgi:hypothetical protein
MCPRRPFGVLNTKNVVVSDTPRLMFAGRLTKKGSRDFVASLASSEPDVRVGVLADARV